ncbi:MAG: class III signal peptide-containing protein [Candidatus Diapherotrites archaeon]|nr:class III signal peptide-containing protein [Candidatus Diapherotrites archaeon]
MEIKIGLEKLARDSKAQVSAELILIMAAVLAVAILLVKQLQDTAKSGSKKIDEKADKVFKEIDKIK